MSPTSEAPVTLSVPEPVHSAHEHEDEAGRTYLLLGLTKPMNDRLEELALRSRISKAEIINRAVGLYKAAADAIAEGKRVGIASEDQELDTEFVGF